MGAAGGRRAAATRPERPPQNFSSAGAAKTIAIHLSTSVSLPLDALQAPIW